MGNDFSWHKAAGVYVGVLIGSTVIAVATDLILKAAGLPSLMSLGKQTARNAGFYVP